MAKLILPNQLRQEEKRIKEEAQRILDMDDLLKSQMPDCIHITCPTPYFSAVNFVLSVEDKGPSLSLDFGTKRAKSAKHKGQ